MFKQAWKRLYRADWILPELPVIEKEAEPVRFDIVHAIELKDNADYILVTDSRNVRKDDMAELVAQVQKIGMRNVVGFMLSGGSDESVQVIERPRTARDNTGRFAKKGN